MQMKPSRWRYPQQPPSPEPSSNKVEMFVAGAPSQGEELLEEIRGIQVIILILTLTLTLRESP